MTDGIPTLAEALAGKAAIADSVERSNGRVHRMDDRPARPLPPPPKPTVPIATRVHRIDDDDLHLDPPRVVPPPPEAAPFPPFLKRERTTKEDESMPTGHYDRTNRTAAMRAKKVGDSPPPVAAPKKKRKAAAPKKPPTATPRGNGAVHFAVDDRGGISIIPNEGDPIELTGEDAKRLTVFLDRTKGLRA